MILGLFWAMLASALSVAAQARVAGVLDVSDLDGGDLAQPEPCEGGEVNSAR